jgi:septal ring factor EnvC (AmiA/AmiB activator)
MSDEELVKRLRGWAKDIQEGSTAIYAMDLDLKNAASSIEALERDAKAHEKEITVWSENYAAMERKLEAARAATKKAVDAAVDAGASLAAAISLLERGGRKAAPSNKMFDQMLVDYRNSLERTCTALAEIRGEKT